MKKYLNIVVLFVCLMSGSVHAQGIAMFGFEDDSCGAWAKSAQEHEVVRGQYIKWVRGFISGSNWMTPGNQANTSGGLSSETISLYLDKYCRENPLQHFINGVFELVRELRGDKN